MDRIVHFSEDEMTRLDGRRALITGSTAGIGAGIARAFAAEGALVVLTGRDVERGTALAAELGGEFVAADLAAGPAAVAELARRATELAGGRLDVLVNNAAYLIPATATADTDPAVVAEALTVSVAAPFLLTAAIAPAMAAAGGGAIVNIGSINGIAGMAGAALYGATKAALHSMTKSWAAEFGPVGVRVNTLAPGPTATDRNEAIKDMLAGIVAAIPSRRMSTVAEVAAAAVFLASDEASNVHGATLSVDGGFTTV
jgi:NAD(P)-dependent dehydrogenase (short-subunit alcohol dehydrogenase family)